MGCPARSPTLPDAQELERRLASGEMRMGGGGGRGRGESLGPSPACPKRARALVVSRGVLERAREVKPMILPVEVRCYMFV